MGQLTETVLSRLLDQQKDGPNWIKLLTIIAEEFEEIITALVSMSSETWKDTAEGYWLDRVGEIVGVLRPPEEEVDNIFTVTEVGEEDPDTLHSFGEVGSPTEGGFVWDLFGISLGTFASDENFLDFIDAKIAATNADASIPGLARYVLHAFGLTCTVTSPEAGKVVIELPATGFDLRQRRYLELFCPAVAGVDVYFEGWPEV